MLVVLVVLFASFYQTFAKVYNNPSALERSLLYDYIVVGAGTAGNVIATRLTEDPQVSVLLLEAGVSNVDAFNTTVPLLAPTLSVPGSRYDWNYAISPQPGLSGRSFPYPRGKLLGGSSSVNYMTYSHGSSDDWNRFAQVTEDDGWKWDNMKRYIYKNEKLVPPTDGHNTTGQFEPRKHGFYGTLRDSLPGFPTPLDERIIRTTKQLPNEFPYIGDTSGGDILGIGWKLSTIANGTRSSSVTDYLNLAIDRPNLDIVINAHVTKLLNTALSGHIPIFRSVQFTENEEAQVRTAIAKKEVILCAGSFGTPMILQRSGIGERVALESLGIETIIDKRSVGRNLSDHVGRTTIYSVLSNDTFDDILRSPDKFQVELSNWTQNKTGPLGAALSNHVGWLRLPQNSSIFETVPDPAAGLRSSHFEFLFSSYYTGSPIPPSRHFMSVRANLISPTSRGSVSISSSNPFANPIINPNYLNTSFDIFALVEAVKTARRFINSDSWIGFVEEEYGSSEDAKTDAEIEKLIRDTAGSVFHAVGTAAMSSKNARWGVVDPSLLVKGANGLRIVDASVLPFVPNAHTQGPVYLLAERAADLIKNK
ncbi:hypothetical protein BDQ12DRAFT_715549 [Crucibulum laeve]|uniref:pyranose dehydrogenase (acceptor) n=1 Tax=Crucibulum laeve TaxID=68775 RepID=A0A5C3LLS0_9AGAR|nr:hypothetical protein BDQ12DRAFT_715549 [Crucibulum laeve]